MNLHTSLCIYHCIYLSTYTTFIIIMYSRVHLLGHSLSTIVLFTSQCITYKRDPITIQLRTVQVSVVDDYNLGLFERKASKIGTVTKDGSVHAQVKSEIVQAKDWTSPKLGTVWKNLQHKSQTPALPLLQISKCQINSGL